MILKIDARINFARRSAMENIVKYQLGANTREVEKLINRIESDSTVDLGALNARFRSESYRSVTRSAVNRRKSAINRDKNPHCRETEERKEQRGDPPLPERARDNFLSVLRPHTDTAPRSRRHL